MAEFKDFPLSRPIIHTLDGVGVVKMTAVQEKVVPTLIQGRDILLLSPTGSGKTLGFVVPMLERLLRSHKIFSTALILAPTRELAIQICDVVDQLLAASIRNMRSALLIGGEGMNNQALMLRQRPRVIVGTPGRVLDHWKRGNLSLIQNYTLIMDEVDKLVEGNLRFQTESIVEVMPRDCQKIMSSATFSSRAQKIFHQYMENVQRISVLNGGSETHEGRVVQELKITTENRFRTLFSEVKRRKGGIFVFVNSKSDVDVIAKKLAARGVWASSLHGDKPQSERRAILNAFRNKEIRVLVVTDVVSRGVDINHISHIVNYDMPNQQETYIHRIGRVARNGSVGNVVNFIGEESCIPSWYETY